MDTYDDEVPDTDTDIAMREMMGFGNFMGTKRMVETRESHHHNRHRGQGSGANAQPLAERTHISNSASNKNHNFESSNSFIPASVLSESESAHSHHPMQLSSQNERNSKGDDIESSSVTQPQMHAFQPPSISGQPSHGFGGHDYVKAKTGFTLTAAELRDYSAGRKEQHLNPVSGELNEVTVYFQPNFVEDDPWSGLMDANNNMDMDTSSAPAPQYGRSGRDGGRGRSRHQRGGRYW